MDHGQIQQFVASNSIATNASGTGKTQDCAQYANLRVYAAAANTSTPVGTFKLQGSENGTAWFDVTLPLGSVHGSGFTAPSAAAVSVAWDGTAALSACINVEWPFRYMRYVWTRSSGGNASVFFAVRAGWRG
jgi:hypothetical protein